MKQDFTYLYREALHKILWVKCYEVQRDEYGVVQKTDRLTTASPLFWECL